MPPVSYPRSVDGYEYSVQLPVQSQDTYVQIPLELSPDSLPVIIDSTTEEAVSDFELSVLNPIRGISNPDTATLYGYLHDGVFDNLDGKNLSTSASTLDITFDSPVNLQALNVYDGYRSTSYTYLVKDKVTGQYLFNEYQYLKEEVLPTSAVTVEFKQSGTPTLFFQEIVPEFSDNAVESTFTYFAEEGRGYALYYNDLSSGEYSIAYSGSYMPSRNPDNSTPTVTLNSLEVRNSFYYRHADNDEDGIDNESDTCPNYFNPDQVYDQARCDFDQDGVIDAEQITCVPRLELEDKINVTNTNYCPPPHYGGCPPYQGSFWSGVYSIVDLPWKTTVIGTLASILVLLGFAAKDAADRHSKVRFAFLYAIWGALSILISLRVVYLLLNFSNLPDYSIMFFYLGLLTMKISLIVLWISSISAAKIHYWGRFLYGIFTWLFLYLYTGTLVFLPWVVALIYLPYSTISQAVFFSMIIPFMLCNCLWAGSLHHIANPSRNKSLRLFRYSWFVFRHRFRLVSRSVLIIMILNALALTIIIAVVDYHSLDVQWVVPSYLILSSLDLRTWSYFSRRLTLIDDSRPLR